MMEATFYELLGVPANADTTIIAAAYLTRLQQVAQSGEAPQVTGEVMQLTQAYSVLAEAGRRAAYDHVLACAAMVRDGYQATYQVTITASEARVGTTRTLTFHRPDGQPHSIVVSIPPGCRPGDRIRLAGVGGPSLDGTRRGDLIVELVVSGR